MNLFKDLCHSKLFSGLTEAEFSHVLSCLQVTIKQYTKDEFIFRQGDLIHHFGIILKGSIFIIQEDFYGNRNIISEMAKGESFAEALAFSGTSASEVSVIAKEESQIIFFNPQIFINICEHACPYHNKLIHNLLSIISERNQKLTKKVNVLSKKTIRDRLLSYLSSESLQQGKQIFTVPYNRQELADYLSVDRSALSNEISKLRQDGVLRVNRNLFELLD